MIICLDYDKTYTADPILWDEFIKICKLRKHEIICITMRKPNKEEEINRTKFKVDKLYYTSRKAKKKWAEMEGIAVDIWIDDKPAWILEDCFSG